MIGARRNLFVLLFVIGLSIASVVAIISQPTKLGLDLEGGTSLVYQGQPTPQQPEVTPEAIDRAIEIIRQRIDTLGVSDIDRAVDVIGTTAQLQFYDWQPNVIAEDPDDPQATEQGFPRLIDAVRLASKQKPECFQDLCTTNGPRHYMFDADSFELLAGPEQRKTDLFLDEPVEKRPDNVEILEVPQGTVVVEEPQQDNPETEADESAESPPEFFVLRDRPQLSGTDITNPEQNFDPNTNQPNVTFDFTDEGREAFQEITETIA